MPSVLHILRWSIISLRCLFLHIRIHIVTILGLIPIDITGSQVSAPHSALIHHWLAMSLPAHPDRHPHCCNSHPHTHWHHWFPGQTSGVPSRAVIAGWWWGSHGDRYFHHLHLRNLRCPLASRNEVPHQFNCSRSGCLGHYIQSQAPQAPLRRPINQAEYDFEQAQLSCWSQRVVLATHQGNLRAVRVLTGSSVQFYSRPWQKPEQLCLVGFATQTRHRTVGIWLGVNWTAVANVRFLLVWLQLSIWVVIVSWHSQYVSCSALARLSPPAFKLAIRLILVEWLWNNGWCKAKLAGVRSRINEYFSDRKPEGGRRNRE